MKMKFRIISSIAIAAVTTLMVGSCASDPDSSGLEYMPDMYRSPAIEPYVDYGEIKGRENKDVKLKLSAMTPPSGTIPYCGTDSVTVALMMPYARKANISMKTTHGMYGADLTEVNEYDLAASDENLLALNSENSNELFATGKKLFTANCAHCHGAKGDGNGPMVLSGAYTGVPDYANLADLGDGQLFYSIYYGKGMMGAHNPILDKKEIWTLVHYIRKFQDADYGSFSAVEDVEVAEAN
jgi:mono/diheme cytochrome c family protein